MSDAQDAFDLYVRRDLARHFDMPTDMPFEMVSLVNQITQRDQPIGA